MGSIYDWSLAAADNANADDSINWAEGQPPSTVNNSARFMMQRVRELLSDWDGTLIAGGLSNGLTLKSNAPLRSYKDGIIIRFRASGLNGAQTSLNLNNLGAKPIMKAGAGKAVPLTGGELQAGSIHECIYCADLGSGGAWFLSSPPFIPPPAKPSFPAGFVAPFCGMEAPEGWLKCNGAWVGKMEFRALYDAIGTGFGGDNTRFALPDLRGEFIRGWAESRDVPGQKGRGLGQWESDRLKFHRHRGATDSGGAHNHDYALYNQGNADGGGYHRGIGGDGRHNEQTGFHPGHAHNFTTDWGADDDSRFAEETRPRNIALLYCIKC